MTTATKTTHWGHDRFIPYQSKEKAETYAALVVHDQTNKILAPLSHRRALSRACFEVPSPTDLKILSAATTLSPEPKPWARSPHKDLPAILSKSPLHILDAPELYSDFYINPFSYSTENSLLAVGLGCNIWFRDTAAEESIECSIPPTTGRITAIAWSLSGEEIFVGKTDGEIFCATVPMDRGPQTLLWTKTIATSPQADLLRFSALAQSGDDLFAGNRCGHCYKIDRRTGVIKNSWLVPANDAIGILEICQIKVSPNGQYLAIGTNQNSIAVYETETTSAGNPSPIFHKVMNAAVKGIAFNPSERAEVAFGAGSTDRRIMIASLPSGRIIRTIDATAQVTSLLWDTPETLLATLGAGSSPSMLSIPIAEMHGDPVLLPITGIPSEVRVLHSANLSNTSPPQWVVVSNDEMIRFFPKTEEKPPLKVRKERHPMTPYLR